MGILTIIEQLSKNRSGTSGPPTPPDPGDGTVGRYVYFFGDSITNGVGASDTAYCWRVLLTVAKNWIGVNMGINGTAITPNACIDYLNINTIPAKTTDLKYLFIAFGVNDIFTSGEVTSISYQAALDAAINHAINIKNWPAYRIVIISPFFTDPATSGGYCSGPSFDETRKFPFVTTAQTVAGIYTTKYYNIYQRMKDNGGVSLLADGIHPNDAGHNFIYSDLLTYVNTFTA